jgi:hypothetical protein
MLDRRYLALTILALAGPAAAQPGRFTIPDDKYQITDEERAACQNDAVLFCSMAYPDEDALLGCMKVVRPKLTPVCRTTFEAGLRRRHIPF